MSRCCVQMVLVFTNVDSVLIVLDLHMKFTVEVVPLHNMYIVWFVTR